MGCRKSRAVFSRILRRSNFEKEGLNGFCLVRKVNSEKRLRKGKGRYGGGRTVGLERTLVSPEEETWDFFKSIFGCLCASVNLETIRRQF